MSMTTRQFPGRTAWSRPLAVAAATAAVLAVWAIASQVAGLDVRLSVGARPEHVAAVTAAVVTALAGLAGWAVLALLERVAPLRSRRTWIVLAAVVLAVSLAGPLDAGTTTATKIAPACLHLAAAGVLIPALARSTARP
jgi:hypothetical protein